MPDYADGYVRPSGGSINSPAGFVRTDKAAGLAGANNEYVPGQLDSGGSLRVTEEGGKVTYYANSAFSCDSTATDIAFVAGVTTKVLKIHWIEVWSAATATADGLVSIVRRSAANTAGTAAAATIVAADVDSAAAVAAPKHYTAHPTALGTGVVAWGKRMGQQALGAVGGCVPLFFDFRPRFGGQGLRVKNVATDIIAVNAAAALGGSGNVWSITWCWSECPTTE